MRSFEALVGEAEAADVTGWGFGWLEGRATEERPPWGYARLLAERLGAVRSALDVDTGGTTLDDGGRIDSLLIVLSQEGYFEYSEFPWGRIVAAFMAACLISFLVAAVRGSRTGRSRRNVAVVALGWTVLWLSVAWLLIAPARAGVDGATIECASPAAASTMHGVPDDSSMSEANLACRTAGRWRLALLVVLVTGGTAAGVVAMRPRSSAR